MTKCYLKKKIRELECEIMNGRQAAKLAAKKIEEMEHYNARCKADITAYNRVIVGMIEGTINPCDWCEENEECEKEVKGKGCSEWWLAFTHPSVEEVNDSDSQGVPVTGSDGGTGDEAN